MAIISGLNFTVEHAINDKLPFLKVLVNIVDGNVQTTVYRKPTDACLCLNAKSECPNKYKLSVIKGFLHRAKSLSSDRKDMFIEIDRAKQILINNGYSNSIINAEIRKFLNQDTSLKAIVTGVTYNLYYKNVMHSNYRADEISIKRIITSNVILKNNNNKINVIVYYKTKRTKQLIMKNNQGPKVRDLSKARLVYDFQCKKEACKQLQLSETRYTGLTTCHLTRRLSYHLQSGAIRKHFEQKHTCRVTRQEIVDWTKIRYFERDVNRLEILESLIIIHEDPALNRQDTGKPRLLCVYGN